ncbi:DUF2235 domain-containing protein [Halomonas sp. 18H]|uniref:DUF2235 domain-containing protein n=1 Tax=Halomonas almeriensis TaxID=308163 RepID=UPI0022308DB3|nr:MULTISPECIES: DUF2235 domain-containing protein [Halomonas]MCW4152779.1 DUF2235 domain-containing protein [Halomonas sp. 18H]MDN3552023.1 DUF2235 domain-containing protein [Halomonas almeriensis]
MAHIVICADGTWNRPEEDLATDHPTNVLKLSRAIRPEANGLKQHVFYDWGLGSYHDKLTAGVTGAGIHKNILDGYRYILHNHEPGDRIYLFGFSRGAYTVRALSGLINNCGILTRQHARLVTEAWKVYKSPRAKNHPDGEAARAFRANYSHASRHVHFIGVWDTVGALGIPHSLMGLFDRDDEFYDTKIGANVSTVRHAMAIDEKREDFKPTIWLPREGVDLKQVWFAGVHSDVGGSYPPDRNTGVRASDTPLQWMLNQAESAGLQVEPHLRDSLTNGAAGKLHKSRKHVYRFTSPLQRELVDADRPTLIHPSVKRRYQEDPRYRPPQLKALVESHGWDNLGVGE